MVVAGQDQLGELFGGLPWWGVTDPLEQRGVVRVEEVGGGGATRWSRVPKMSSKRTAVAVRRSASGA
jgi:hypothetical protein